MTHTLSARSYVRTTPRLSYRRPPVHEVVVSLSFATPIAESQLQGLPELLRSRLPVLEPQEEVTMGVSFSPAGTPIVESKKIFDGWRVKDSSDKPSRVISAGRRRLNIHAVRPGLWPTGEYAGWPAIFEEMTEFTRSLSAVYSNAVVERAGLRYLNRIAVPVRTKYEEWFNAGFRAPSFLTEPYAVNLRQTWARIETADDMSATVGLAAIEIPEPSLKEDFAGFLLDIEVFNLRKDRAPSFSHLSEWCRRAHDIEGDIFEWSITDALRHRFEVISQ